jgi:hypothetical protein
MSTHVLAIIEERINSSRRIIRSGNNDIMKSVAVEALLGRGNFCARRVTAHCDGKLGNKKSRLS